MLETIREFAAEQLAGVGRGRATRTTSPRVLPRSRRGRRRAAQGRRVRARATRRGARQSSQRLRYRARARPRAGARAGREAWPLLEPARSLSRRTAEARGCSRGGSRCSSLRSRPCTQRSRQSRSLAGGSRRRRATRARGSRAREGTRRQEWVGLRAQPSRDHRHARDPSARRALRGVARGVRSGRGRDGPTRPLQNLASNALARGDNERAISLLRERVAGTRGRDTYSLALAIGLLGFALAANGESEEARQSFEESLEMCRVHGFSRAEAEVLSGLADLMRTTSPARALEYYRESIELAWKMGYLALVAVCLRGIATIALASGDARDAATLLGVFAGVVERIGAIPSGGKGRARRDNRPGQRSAGERRVRGGMGRGRRFEPRTGGRALAHDDVTRGRPRPDLSPGASPCRDLVGAGGDNIEAGVTSDAPGLAEPTLGKGGNR